MFCLGPSSPCLPGTGVRQAEDTPTQRQAGQVSPDVERDAAFVASVPNPPPLLHLAVNFRDKIKHVHSDKRDLHQGRTTSAAPHSLLKILHHLFPARVEINNSASSRFTSWGATCQSNRGKQGQVSAQSLGKVAPPVRRAPGSRERGGDGVNRVATGDLAVQLRRAYFHIRLPNANQKHFLKESWSSMNQVPVGCDEGR